MQEFLGGESPPFARAEMLSVFERAPFGSRDATPKNSAVCDSAG
jgi:hypothetical protein